MSTLTIGIYLYDQVEALDFAGPFEVFTTASRMALRDRPEAPPPFRVVTLARHAGTIQARAGLVTYVDNGLSGHPALDVLIVPGGVVEQELQSPDVLAWLRYQSRRVPLIASVCTGAFLLAEAGLLDGRSATTHWEDLEDLRRRYPTVKVESGRRWYDEGPVVTAAGIAAGIDMALHLVERLAGRPLAERTARQMDVEWRERA